MRIVHLDGDLLGNLFQIGIVGEESAQNVPQSASNEEVLLQEAQFFARFHLIRRIQHARDVFAGDLLLDGANVITAIENLDIEVFGSLRGKEAQIIDGSSAVTGNR